MESSLNKRRVTATALAGLLTALIVITVPGITPDVAARPLDDETTAAEEVAPPHMALAKMTHDAGRVERGEMITHRFTFRNTGGSDLVILSTKAG
jgi:hypothetical protein